MRNYAHALDRYGGTRLALRDLEAWIVEGQGAAAAAGWRAREARENEFNVMREVCDVLNSGSKGQAATRRDDVVVRARSCSGCVFKGEEALQVGVSDFGFLAAQSHLDIAQGVARLVNDAA